MKQSRKKLIKNLYTREIYYYQLKIKKEFPKLFISEKLDAGKWYTLDEVDVELLFCFSGKLGNNTQYGFWRGEDWSNRLGLHEEDLENCKLATEMELEKAFIKEAEKRGYAKGNFKCLYLKEFVSGSCNVGFSLSENLFWSEYGCCFHNGEWAEIIKETITKEQAEKELGKTII